MKNITKITLSIFLIILLASGAFGFAGMGGNANNTTIPQDTGNTGQIDFNNATESDQDIIMVQHLIEVDAVQLKAENRLSIRETLIFRNTGSKDFVGNLRTWIPDGSENIKVSQSEMTSDGVTKNLDFVQNGNIISWNDSLKQNSPPRFLYVVEYDVPQEGAGTTSNKEKFNKKLVFPTLINYKYVERLDLAAVVVKITKPEGSNVTFTDENGDKIAATEMDEKGDIYRFSSPEFKEINVEVSQSSLAPDAPEGTPNYTVYIYIILAILIVLVLSYPYIKKKLQSNRKGGSEGKSQRVKQDIVEDTVDEEIEEPSEVESAVPSGKFKGKNIKELEDLKIGLLSRIKNLEKKYESGELLDEEYEDKKKSYQDELKEIENRLKNME